MNNQQPAVDHVRSFDTAIHDYHLTPADLPREGFWDRLGGYALVCALGFLLGVMAAVLAI